MTAEAAATPTIRPVGTDYQILKVTNDHEYLDCGPIKGRSAEHALTRYVEKNKPDNGSKFRAVPARSWPEQPFTVTLETQTTVKLT